MSNAYLNRMLASFPEDSFLIISCITFAFHLGLSNYFDGTALSSKHDIVYVSFNYRVGAFGNNSWCKMKFSRNRAENKSHLLPISIVMCLYENFTILKFSE